MQRYLKYFEHAILVFIDTIDIYVCAFHNAKVACYKYTAGFAFV